MFTRARSAEVESIKHEIAAAVQSSVSASSELVKTLDEMLEATNAANRRTIRDRMPQRHERKPQDH